MTAVANCAVMRNPFSTAVATARIPDGSASLSSASRLSTSQRYTSTSETVTIALFPGFSTHLAVSGAGVGPGGTNLSSNFVAPSMNISSRFVTAAGTGNDLTIVQNVNAPQKYRIAAQGMRISLIENTENNDGWFEAIRIPSAYDAKDFCTIPADGSNKLISLMESNEVFGGNLGLYNGTLKNWAMNPTYITGKLRDINRHTFMLHRENDHDFVDLGEQNSMIGSPTTGAYAEERFVRSAGNKTWWVDPNLDTVLVRCFSSTAGSATGQNLHIHTVQHVEEQFEPDSELARYMTKPPSNPALTTAVMNLIRRGIKPSIVRAPTGAVSVKFNNTPRTVRRRTRAVRRTRSMTKRPIKRRRVLRRRR